MTVKGEIAEYRERLDKTLASHDLTDEETLKSQVMDHLLRSSEHDTQESMGDVVDKRTTELSNYLGMMRSASDCNDGVPQQPSWKLKQDTEEIRVMYREGPEGSPFHTLLVEGFVDAPLDACLCVSIEAAFTQHGRRSRVLNMYVQDMRDGQDSRMLRQLKRKQQKLQKITSTTLEEGSLPISSAQDERQFEGGNEQLMEATGCEVSVHSAALGLETQDTDGGDSEDLEDTNKEEDDEDGESDDLDSEDDDTDGGDSEDSDDLEGGKDNLTNGDV